MQDEAFRARLPAQSPSGDRVVLIAAPNERIKSLSARIAEVGMPVTLFVWARNRVLSWATIVKPSEVEHEHQSDEAIMIHPQITVKFMMDAVRAKNGCAVFHFADPDDEPSDYRLAAVPGGPVEQTLEDAFR
jgi:hypothetical protein